MAEAETPETEARGAVSDFLQTLGLTDLVFGSILLYWVRLAIGGATARTLFPSTGHDLVDVALLACAAAFAGKALSLVVAILMAVLGVLIVNRSGYYRALSNVIMSYNGLSNGTIPASDVVALAVREVALSDSREQSTLERIRSNAIIAYSVAILVAPFIALYVRAAPAWLPGCGIVVGIGFLGIGILHQLDYVKTLRIDIEVLFRNRSWEAQRIQQEAHDGGSHASPH